MTTTTASRALQFPTVGQYMTAHPHTIAPHQSLATARRLMLEHGVRHLPVLDGGQVAGILTERDLLLVESMPGVAPAEVKVEDAMVEATYTEAPDAPIADVVEQMVKRKLGSAVIVEGAHVVGVFTSIDALRALHDLLQAAP
jgi:acetoin utilization protein AcuB